MPLFPFLLLLHSTNRVNRRQLLQKSPPRSELVTGSSVGGIGGRWCSMGSCWGTKRMWGVGWKRKVMMMSRCGVKLDGISFSNRKREGSYHLLNKGHQDLLWRLKVERWEVERVRSGKGGKGGEGKMRRIVRYKGFEGMRVTKVMTDV